MIIILSLCYRYKYYYVTDMNTIMLQKYISNIIIISNVMFTYVIQSLRGSERDLIIVNDKIY